MSIVFEMHFKTSVLSLLPAGACIYISTRIHGVSQGYPSSTAIIGVYVLKQADEHIKVYYYIPE